MIMLPSVESNREAFFGSAKALRWSGLSWSKNISFACDSLDPAVAKTKVSVPPIE